MLTCVTDTYTFTYSTDIAGSVKAKDVLEATRHLFRMKGIGLEDFDDLKLINNLAMWELHIVTDSILASQMPDTEYDDTQRRQA